VGDTLAVGIAVAGVAGIAVVVVGIAAAVVVLDTVAEVVADIAEAVDTAMGAEAGVAGVDIVAVVVGTVAAVLVALGRLQQIARTPDSIEHRLVLVSHNYCKVPWFVLLSFLTAPGHELESIAYVIRAKNPV
jgi:hypothetical protein